MIGKSLGPYKILEPLGAGGMGEVFLGEDTRLGRKVAIKVLPEEFASDPTRLARFEQEARAAAALNHPHIAVVHDVGAEKLDGDGSTVHFMVQEHLEGETLREPLNKGALPLKRALALAAETAEALAAAHGAGIVHRDLKPANLFVTQEGHAKVLDFGLAKLVEPELAGGAGESRLSGSPTVLGTVAGQVMGTAGYMAPEQVAGEEIDHRVDIFAFGCVLYEMAGGKQAFTAGSVLDTLHAIAHDDPQPLAEINPALPAELHRILKKCLAKEPSDRYQGAGELATDVRSLAGEVEAGTAAPLGSGLGDTHTASGLRLPVPIGLSAAAMVAVALIAGVAGWVFRQPSAPEPGVVQRYTIPIPDIGSGQLTTIGTSIAITRDGRHIAYSGDLGDGVNLHHRPTGTLQLTMNVGLELSRRPAFSPDGQWLTFEHPEGTWRVPLAGGTPLNIGEFFGARAFGPDDSLVYSDGRALYQTTLTGVDPVLVAEPDPDSDVTRYRRPNILPGGGILVEVRRGAGFGVAGIGVLAPVTRDLTIIAEQGSDPQYAPTGHVVYARLNTLEALPFDPIALQPLGPSVPVVQDVRVEGGGAGQYAFSDNGVLVYWPDSLRVSGGQRRLAWVDRQGNETIVDEREEDFRA
ncbi:MAG: serine/threonine-protein kinase, partial [Acidobacteria bacterium]|nr:serine/threonine-protein kinase [Acidobacteriota bacterium]